MDLAFEGRSYPLYLRKAFTNVGGLSAKHIPAKHIHKGYKSPAKR